MSESFIPASEFETACNAVKNILGQPVEEIEITDILPPLNDIADSNKVFKGKLSVLFVDMRKSTDLTDELKSKKMVKVYRSFIRIVIQAIRYSGGYTRQFAGDGFGLIGGVQFMFSPDIGVVFLYICAGEKGNDVCPAGISIAGNLDGFLIPAFDQTVGLVGVACLLCNAVHGDHAVAQDIFQILIIGSLGG